MKAIAVQHARHGVRCNSVLPGWIESDMTAGHSSGTGSSTRYFHGSRPSLGSPADFGGLAVYLASPASSYHTGDVITIDGGYHSF